MALEARKGANLANVGAGFAVLSAVLAVSIAINIALLGFLPGVYQPKQAGYGQSHTKTSTNTAVQQPLERAKDETSVSSTSGSLPASQGSVINLDQ